MNKKEIIEKLAFRTGQTKAEAQKSLESLLDLFTDTLQNGEKITLVGFGTFDVQQTAGRTGRNPQTGQPMQIKPKKRVRFKAGAELSGAVN